MAATNKQAKAMEVEEMVPYVCDSAYFSSEKRYKWVEHKVLKSVEQWEDLDWVLKAMEQDVEHFHDMKFFEGVDGMLDFVDKWKQPCIGTLQKIYIYHIGALKPENFSCNCSIINFNNTLDRPYDTRGTFCQFGAYLWKLIQAVVNQYVGAYLNIQAKVRGFYDLDGLLYKTGVEVNGDAMGDDPKLQSDWFAWNGLYVPVKS
jgi:hypothetical protein